MSKQLRHLVAFVMAVIMLIGSIPVSAMAAPAPAQAGATATMSSASGGPGDLVKMDITVKDAPGFNGFILFVNYDSMLTLKSVEFNPTLAERGGLVTSPQPYTNPQQLSFISWEKALDINGVFATLTFQISEAAGDGYKAPVTLSYSPDDVQNDSGNVPLTTVDGAVTVYRGLPGDITGDGVVNTKDPVALFRYISGWSNQKVDPDALDCNGDGKANSKDAVLLFRFVAGWPVKITRHHHVMEEVPYKAATCTEDGNAAYWHCSACGKNYNDAYGTKELTDEQIVMKAKGHTVVIDPYVAPQIGVPGKTEGSHCSVCNNVLKAQQEIPALEEKTYPIVYHITERDTYLQELDQAQKLENPNPAVYKEDEALRLVNLSVPGYVFEGWFDGEGDNAVQIKTIENQTGTVHLYAHWKAEAYSVTFSSPLVPMDSITHTVNKPCPLNNPPELAGYRFMGWTTEEGHRIEEIPVGLARNVTLYGNWTSERNLTRPVEKLQDPIIDFDQEHNRIQFAYEIGTVENIPLYEYEYLHMPQPGEITRSYKFASIIDEGTARTVSESISRATTQSSSWTLSNEWNETTTRSESHMGEVSQEIAQDETAGVTSGGSFNISSSRGGSHEVHVEQGVSAKVGAKASAEASVSVPLDVVDVKGKVSSEVSSEVSTSASMSATDTKTWNTNKGYSASRETSKTRGVSQSLASKISNSNSFECSQSASQSSSNTVSTAETSTAAREYDSTFQYNKQQIAEQSYTVSIPNAAAGHYRIVCAGIAHVYAVVTYDIAERAYGVYTYSIMEDKTYPFFDYSSETRSFNDNENGVLPVEIPYFVNEYVNGIVGASDGLVINENTGVIEDYVGRTENGKTVYDEIVVVPQYISIPSGTGHKAVKVTGLADGLFKNNKTIKAVQLSDNITAIPDNAFSGCTNLQLVVGDKVTSIGANAFANCTGLKPYTVPAQVTSLGANAFTGVGKVSVYAANAGVAASAVTCGAKNIALTAEGLGKTWTGSALRVPASADSFLLDCRGDTFRGITIRSDAKKTSLHNMTLTEVSGTALECASGELVLDNVTVNAPGAAMRLTAPQTRLALQGTNHLTSGSSTAVITKGLELAKNSTSVSSALELDGNLLICGTLTDPRGMLRFSRGKVVYYDDSQPMVFTVTWNTDPSYTVSVVRTESPQASAPLEELHSGSSIYMGDVLSIRYTANPGYAIQSHGITQVTVMEDLTAAQIYAKTVSTNVTYNIVYKSTNGSPLGTGTVTHAFGTTNTVTPKAFSGYTTPAAQTVVWDSNSAKTITFSYKPTPVAQFQHPISGAWWTYQGKTAMSYKMDVEIGRRFKDGVDVRITWTNRIEAGKYFGYAQYFNGSAGSRNFGEHLINSASAWGKGSANVSKVRTKEVKLDWIRVPLNTTDATTVKISGQFWDTANARRSYSGTIQVPAW